MRMKSKATQDLPCEPEREQSEPQQVNTDRSISKGGGGGVQISSLEDTLW